MRYLMIAKFLRVPVNLGLRVVVMGVLHFGSLFLDHFDFFWLQEKSKDTNEKLSRLGIGNCRNYDNYRLSKQSNRYLLCRCRLVSNYGGGGNLD